MIRLGDRFRAQHAARSSVAAGASPARRARNAPRVTPTRVRVTPDPATDDGNIFLFHQDPETAGHLAEVARGLRDPDPTQVILLVGAGAEDAENLREQFATVLTDGPRRDVRRAVLVMEGAARERGGRPAVAAGMSDEWAVEVVAPEGRPLIVPGGHLFAGHGPDAPEGPARWWRFAPGAAPRALGSRYPAPRWQSALARLAPDIAADHLLEEIPAGLLIRHTGARPADARGIRHSVPVDADRLCVLVGAPGAPDAPEVSAEALATLLAALPAPVRQGVRLVPGAGGDLLPTAQATADLLGTEIEVTTGLLVVMEEPAAADRDQIVVMTSDGNPAWQPYAGSVVCVPAGAPGAPGPRLGRWRSPVAGLERAAGEGVLRWDEWHLAVTRAGLWIGPADVPRPPLREHPVHPDVVVIDLGLPGRYLDDTLWPALDRLVGSLESASRVRAEIHVRGGIGAEGLRTLRRLAVRHGGTVITRAAHTAAPAAASAAAPAVASTDAVAATPATGTAVVAPPPVLPVWEYEPGAPVPGTPGHALPPYEGSELPDISAGPVPAGEDVPAAEELPTAAPAAAAPAAVAPAFAAAPPASAAPVAAPLAATVPSTPAAPPASAAAPTPGYALESAGEPALTAVAAFPARDDATTAAPRGLPPDPAPGGAGPFTASSPAASPAASGAASPADPVVPAPAAGTGHGRRSTEPSRPAFPFTPTHRSTPADREALRGLVGDQWDQHSAALTRALSRLPALRVQAQREDARADLIAVRAYLTSPEGKLSHRGVERAFADGDRDIMPFVACAASGLRRLPSHRGPAARSAGTESGAADGLIAGQELCQAGPMSALVLEGMAPSATVDRYLIWSVVGRRVRPLLEQSTAPDVLEEIVFGPGTRFRVLAVDDAAGSRLILLRELGPSTPPGRPGQALDSQDVAILDRLRAAAPALETGSGAAPEWPDRCTGALPRSTSDLARQ
ncbi:hypothetical protein ACFYPN_30660 [Streptomyces sp. NPDC005576]|uniref:hypothetical protein n=1 Tax=Streptomyces sp. NPDC005576 TaxID=3364726 RepID=UPI00368B1281